MGAAVRCRRLLGLGKLGCVGCPEYAGGESKQVLYSQPCEVDGCKGGAIRCRLVCKGELEARAGCPWCPLTPYTFS